MSAGNTGSRDERVVIVGAGLAGAKTAEALRDAGYAGRITLVGDERHLPYERPPLSKEYLTAGKDQSEFTVHDRTWYDEAGVELRLGSLVTAIDLSARTVSIGDDDLGYSSLVLATGSRSAHPPVEGAEAGGVHYLRSVDDAAALGEVLSVNVRLVVIGGGWIGLEVAAAARGRGVDVTVVEAAEQPLQGPLGRELGVVFADLHRENGVRLLVDSRVESIVTEGGRAAGVRLSGGETLDADVFLMAVGARANVELADNAGLTMHAGGVYVDPSLRTSDPHVYAVGDITAAEHPLYGEPIRTEHWATALNQPAVAAANITGGSAVYDRIPYFFTDQYDLGMEFRGRIDGYASVVTRGDVATREFLVFWLDAGQRVLAGMNVNVWDAGDQITALVGGRVTVAPDALADPTVPLDSLLP